MTQPCCFYVRPGDPCHFGSPLPARRLFLFSRFLFRSRRYSLGLGVLQLGVLAGSRAPLSVQAVVCFTLPNFSRIDSSSLVDLSAFAGPVVIPGKICTK